MVQRKYDAPQFQVQDRRSVQAQQVQGTDTRPNYTREVGDSEWRDRLFANLGQQWTGVASKMLDIELSNQYLEGQAAAGVVQSEEELQGNILTRDWKVAGYRDTMGKLALADQQATFQKDLQELRTQSSEDMQAYLSERRQKMLPVLAGMSREARAATAGQMLMQDRAALKQWTSESTKYIIDTKSQAIMGQWGVAMRGLQEAQIKAVSGQLRPEDYTESMRSTAATLYGSVWLDKSLPVEVKQQLTFEAAQLALSQDSVELYDYLSATPPPGEAGTLISRLTGEQQLKLSNSYREAYSRSGDIRSMARFEQLANVEAQLEADAYRGTRDELVGLLRPMVINKTITGEKMQAVLKKYETGMYKSEQVSQLGQALLRGDMQSLYAVGKDVSDGVKSLEQMLAKRGASPAQQLQTWLTVGRNGVAEGFKKVGEQLGVSLRQMVDSKDGTVLPQHAENFRTINAAIRQAEKDGLANTRVNVLAGLPESERLFAESIFREVDAGAGLDEAVQKAKGRQAADAALSPAARAARSNTAYKDVEKMIAEVEPRGLLESAWLHTKRALGSSSADAELALRPFSGIGDRDGWFGDSNTVQFYTAQTKDAIRQEADVLLSMWPSADPKQAMTVAQANVAGRTISTTHGPIIMPKGVDLQAVFGVAPGNQSEIGRAIDGMLRSEKPDSRWQLRFDQGRLFAQEFNTKYESPSNPQGRVGNGFFLGADQIKARIAEDTAKDSKKAAERYGAGKTVQADGITLKYSGQNTVGVSPDWMFSLRDNLVASESIRSQVYKDTTGKDTVGVGVMHQNPFYPKPDAAGKITSAQASDSFAYASDAAAKGGMRAARVAGRETKEGFLLMAEIAYQSGPHFLYADGSVGKEYREFAEAVKSGNAQAAQAAFTKTAAYRASGESRRQHYARLIQQAMP